MLLKPSDSVTDLGVLMSDNFSFNSHISEISRKANLKSSWEHSVFKTRDEFVMLTLLKSLVRSLLE